MSKNPDRRSFLEVLGSLALPINPEIDGPDLRPSNHPEPGDPLYDVVEIHHNEMGIIAIRMTHLSEENTLIKLRKINGEPDLESQGRIIQQRSGKKEVFSREYEVEEIWGEVKDISRPFYVPNSSKRNFWGVDEYRFGDFRIFDSEAGVNVVDDRNLDSRRAEDILPNETYEMIEDPDVEYEPGLLEAELYALHETDVYDLRLEHLDEE